MKHRRLSLIGILIVLSTVISAPLPAHALRQVSAPGSPDVPSLLWNVAYVGRDVVDMKWDFETGDLGYKVTRDGDLIAKLDVTTTFFRDRSPLPGPHTYVLLRSRSGGDIAQSPDTVTLGSIGGKLYEDLTWSEGTYTIASEVEVMPGATLTIEPGVKVSARSETYPYHPHGLYGEGILDIDGAVLELTDLWIQGDGSEIKNSELLQGTYGLKVEADARLEGNTLGAVGYYFNITGTATVEMVANVIQSSLGTSGSATLVMEKNVFESDDYSTLTLGSSAPAVLSNNRFEGCPPLKGALQVNGSGAVTIRDNVFRCSTSDRYSALAIKVATDNPGIIANNVFEGPYRYGDTDDAAGLQLDAGADIVVEDNVFSEWPVAVRVNGGAGTLTGNTFFNNGVGWMKYGIVVDGNGTTQLNQNCVLNDLEITNRTTALDATQNWWGDPSGPYHEDNPEGLGWTIDGGPVNYTPWLADDTAVCNVVDLAIAGMEVVQSTQSLANSVPLVTGKPALLRVYPESLVGSVSSAPLVVRAYRDGTQIGTRAALVSAATISDIDAVRNSPDGGATIKVPADWLSGTVTLEAEINPDHNSPSEIRYDNNGLSQTVTFEPRRPLRVAYVPVSYDPTESSPTTPTAGNIPNLHTAMANLYPMPGVDYTIWSPLTWYLEMSGSGEKEYARGDLLLGLLTLKAAIVNASRPPAERIDQVFGYMPGGSISVCYSDPPWDGGRGVATYCTEGGMYMAHEIGHNLGLRHPNTADSNNAMDPGTYWPYDNAQIQEVGYDVRGEKLKPSTYFDVMGYNAANEQWISPLHYRMLFNALPEPDSVMATHQANADTTYLLISGQVSTGGTVTFQPFWQVAAQSPPVNPTEGTAYCVETRNGATVLRSQCFNLSFINRESNTAVDTDFFMVSLPLDATTTSVVLTHATTDLHTIPVSANPPQVTLTSPNGGEILDETVTVTWTGSDTDGDDLAYSVLVTADDVTWEPLALNITGTTSIDLDLALVPGSATARFRVEASDGYHTAHDDSNGIVTIGDHAPVATIITPMDGVNVTSAITLTGAAYDPEDGPLTGSSLIWASDQDGELGTGETLDGIALTGGDHVLTLTATDSQGRATAVTVTVSVEAPVSGLTLTNDSPTVLGAATAFTASVAGGTNVTFDWDFGDGETGSGPAITTHTYAMTGTVTAAVTASNAINNMTTTTVVTITSVTEPSTDYSVYLPLVIRQTP